MTASQLLLSSFSGTISAETQNAKAMFFYLSRTALLLSGLASAASVYDRSLHMVYALSTGKGLPQYSDAQLLEHFEQVPGGVTALVPFLLNVVNVSQYDSMIRGVQSRGMIIVPGVGGPPNASNIDAQEYKDMAKAAKPYTDYIRVENMQGFYDEYGQAGLQNFIDYCVSIGYKHVMMNPWPNAANGSLVDFPNSEIDAVFNNVSVAVNGTTLINDPTNWHVVNGPNEQDRAIRPGIPILINYESPGPQDILTNMEESNPGSSIAAMRNTVNDIIGRYRSEDLHWAPPLTESYDAIALGTWGWIAATLGKLSRLEECSPMHVLECIPFF